MSLLNINRILKAGTAAVMGALLLAGCGSQASMQTASADSSRLNGSSGEERSVVASDVDEASREAVASTQTATASGAAPSETSSAARDNGNTAYGTVTEGTQTYRGFRVNNVLHSPKNGDIHYSIYVPDSYDDSKVYALFISLPGYEGLYFQGVGENLRGEDFAFEAQKYNDRMIIVAPQLNDWSETSANQTNALTEYLLNAYRIDRNKVYLEGYSGGGETGSQAVSKRPDLYSAYLMGSSQWDGDYDSVVSKRLPVYLAVGASDSYYGSEPLKEAYQNLHGRYVKAGLSENEINRLLVLDVKKADYFTSRGYDDQHAGGQAFAKDSRIMGWLFGNHQE